MNVRKMSSGLLVAAVTAVLVPSISFAVDAPSWTCRPPPAIALADSNSRSPSYCGGHKVLAVFIKFWDDTSSPYPEDYVCPDSGGWRHDTSKRLPTWGDSILAPYPYHPDSTFYDGSLTDYYDEMSRRTPAQYWIFGDIYNRLPNELTGIKDSLYVVTNYSRDTWVSFTIINREILADIDVSKAGSDTSGPGINFANYDYDGDSWVDGLFMIYRYGKFFWEGYAGLLDSTYTSNDSVYIDGDSVAVKIAAQYGGSITTGSVVNKIHLQSVLAHEWGHSMFGTFQGGHPSYRSVHLSYLSHLGLMDGRGSGNSMAGVERALLGWATPRTLGLGVNGTGDTTVTIRDWVTTGDLIKIPRPDRSSEYFLLENRQRESYYEQDNRFKYGTDTRVSGCGCVGAVLRDEGLAITHVDSIGSSNPHTPHERWEAKHKYVDVECADGLWDSPDSASALAQPDSGWYDDIDAKPSDLPCFPAGDAYDLFEAGGIFADDSNPSSACIDTASATPTWAVQSTCTGIRVYDITTNGDLSMTLSISFINDDASGMVITSTDRDTSASGVQLFVCPEGDADTLAFKITLVNDCGDSVSDYAGTKLTVAFAYGDTNFVATDSTCTERTQCTGSGTTDAHGQATIKVPWIGGHGVAGSQDISCTFWVNGRQIGDTLYVETRSPDIDGNGKIDLCDWARWTGSYLDTQPAEWGDYDYTSYQGDPVSTEDFAIFTPHYLYVHGCSE